MDTHHLSTRGEPQSCKYFRVSGLVQGVGFRYYTHKFAARVGLSGWVKNLDDGNVEIVACGPVSQVKCLADWLHQGPPLARVDRIEEEIMDNTSIQQYSGFVIR